MIHSLKVYVPAKDFTLSQQFYSALGFALQPAHGGTIDCTRDGFTFRLQDHYVEDWAKNFMFVMRVDDVEGWEQLAAEVTPRFAGSRVVPIQINEAADRVLHIVDPSGVIRWVSVNDLNVGRNVPETLRVLDALQTDELCPCNWQKGQATLGG